jgi:hypothetical protein
VVETKKLLIWGKTYPEFSRKHYETVCTGAVDESGTLYRIYPITMRYRVEPLKAYDWIEAEIERNTSDFRPESFKIRQDSIEVVGHIGTKKKGEWAERADLVLREKNIYQSVEALQAAELENHRSLGLVKPKEFLGVQVRNKTKEAREAWERHREEALKQRDLFVDEETLAKDLRFMSVEYRVVFRCDDPACTTTHNFAVFDWGTYQLSRKMFADGGGPPRAQAAVTEEITRAMDPTRRDCYFFLGNTLAHCRNFSVVGFFSPPKDWRRKQLNLLGG